MRDAIHQGQVEHPGDYQRWWTEQVTESYWDYSHVALVSYKLEDGKEVLTGAADWNRQGSGWQRVWRLRLGWWDPRKFFPFSLHV